MLIFLPFIDNKRVLFSIYYFVSDNICSIIEGYLTIINLRVLINCARRIYGLCQNRKTNLEESHLYYQFLADCEEEEAWLKEKTAICKSADIGKDLHSCLSLLQKHTVLEQEMTARYQRFEQVFYINLN